MNRGQRAVLVVVATTALVLTPLILGGVLLGFYLGDAVGYPKWVLGIAFSTVGFVAGMALIFRVIKAVVSRVDGAKR